MSNDVIIRVRVRQDVRDGFGAVSKEAEHAGQQSAEKFSSRFGLSLKRMTQTLQDHIRTAGRDMGEKLGDHSSSSFLSRFGSSMRSASSRLTEIGRSMGDRIGLGARDRISDHVENAYRDANGRLRDSTSGRYVSGSRSTGTDSSRGRGGRGGDGGNANVDIDKQSLLSRFAEWGRESARNFWDNFSDRISSFFSGDLISTIIKTIAVAHLAAALAIPLSAAFTSAVGLALGGGVIAAGVIAAFKDDRITAAGTELKEKLSKAFEDFGKPFRGPVMDFLEQFTGEFMPQLAGFASRVGEAFAPLAGDIGQGLIGMLQNLLPGLEDGLEGIRPIIRELAESMPSIGQALGDFFRIIGEQGDDAAVFFNDLIAVITSTIRVTARLIAFFTSMYANVRAVLDGITSSWRRGVALWGGLIKDLAMAVIEVYVRILSRARSSTAGITAAFRTVFNAVSAAARGMRTVVVGVINAIRAAINSISFSGIINRASNAASTISGFLGGMFAHGGIVGQAASGGVRNNLTWVGERGPELVNLAPGSRVWSNGDSMRMARGGGGGAGGGGGVVRAEWVGNQSGLVREIMNSIQLRVVREFQGRVDLAMGEASA